ncbi:MAG: ATP-dependent DNA helicase RecG [Gammaproteobacteria bacterium]
MEQRGILDRPAGTLTGIGGETVKRLQKLGISTIQDLLFHLPLRYEDRTRLYPIGSLAPGMTALVSGHIELTDVLMRGRRSLLCRISDGSGLLTLRFFHFNAVQRASLKTGARITCFGEVKSGFAGLEMIHPEFRLQAAEKDAETEKSLTPVYPLTAGMNQRTLRKAVRQALSICENSAEELKDWLPEKIRSRFGFPDLWEAVRTLHAPAPSISVQDIQNGRLPALKRLVVEEFLAHYLSLKQSRDKAKQWKAPVFRFEPSDLEALTRSLPFTLTGAQKKIIDEVGRDCARPAPMMRLIQGDVGSGKTVVSAYAALSAWKAGWQTAVMAPTELLAEQHFCNFTGWFEPLGINVTFLTAQIKGKKREEILQKIGDGTAGIVVGTHALFQDAVDFYRLGLIVIDEQHRFGVHQRLALREKGFKRGVRPHQLVMTATPIPRTLAMLEYADLDVSVIDELPPGRKPVVTSVISSDRRQQIIDKINGWTGDGKQTYWVCTLIEESEALQCEAAEKTREKLARLLPRVRIGLVHGRMKSSEKAQVMSAFKQREIDVLVATTVIEVGVDVPNAGLMIIENAERLGMSQLHQLRGRVGRGGLESYCLLMYQPPLSQIARRRLSFLRDHGSGFDIAEEDLKLRGPGDVLGSRQTGQIQFKVADLSRDADLAPDVEVIANLIESESPEAVEPLIRRWLGDNVHYAEV